MSPLEKLALAMLVGVWVAAAIWTAQWAWDRWRAKVRSYAIPRWDGGDQAHPGALPHRSTWRAAARYHGRHGDPVRDAEWFELRSTWGGMTTAEQVEVMIHGVHKLEAVMMGSLVPAATRALATTKQVIDAFASPVPEPTLRDRVVFTLYETWYALGEVARGARGARERARELDPIWPAVVVGALLVGSVAVALLTGLH